MKFPKLFKYKQLNVVDLPQANIIQYFDSSHTFIRDARISGGKVLVHCWAGISRSASCVIAYLMKEYKKTMKSAYQTVKDK